MKSVLSAINLKNELMDNIGKLKSKQITPEVANSIASQSREIVRIMNVQLKIAKLPKNFKKSDLTNF